MFRKCPTSFKLEQYALDLINRQQTEIERLKIENQSLRGAANSYKLHYNEAKTEAVKEFVDRLQIRCIKQGGCLWSSDIGAELKEMTGDTK